MHTPAIVASSRIGDHPEFLATKSMSYIQYACCKPTTPLPNKQLMAIVVRLRINKHKKVPKKYIPIKNVVMFCLKKNQ